MDKDKEKQTECNQRNGWKKGTDDKKRDEYGSECKMSRKKPYERLNQHEKPGQDYDEKA